MADHFVNMTKTQICRSENMMALCDEISHLPKIVTL